jgi:hypothetical protein
MDNEELSHLMDSYRYAQLKYRPRNNWLEGDWNTTQKENTMTEKKLYQINNPLTTATYGHKLAVDSTGKWVMEIKGTGEVKSFDKTLIEEVMPYTVSVQFETGKQVYSYLSNKDQLELNAFYLFDSPMGRCIAQVVKLDTKAPAATKEFKPLAKLNVTLSE